MCEMHSDESQIFCDEKGNGFRTIPQDENITTVEPVGQVMKIGQMRVNLLNFLLNLLPERKFDVEDSAIDYPKIKASEIAKGDGVDRTSDTRGNPPRPYFIIGGVPFFRRYNDDYTSTVIYGNWNSENIITWNTLIPNASFQKLFGLVANKSATRENVLKAINDI